VKDKGDGAIYQSLGKHREDFTCTRTRVEAAIAAGGAGIGVKGAAREDGRAVERVAGAAHPWRTLTPR
jgi:hypothetical protein